MPSIGGKYGTLSEIGFALGYGMPVIGLKTWELIRSDGKVDRGITYVNTPKEAVDMALELIAKAEKPRHKTKEPGI